MNEKLATLYIGALLILALFSGLAAWYKYMHLQDFEFVLPEEEMVVEEETL